MTEKLATKRVKDVESRSNKAFSERPRRKLDGGDIKKSNTKEIP